MSQSLWRVNGQQPSARCPKEICTSDRCEAQLQEIQSINNRGVGHHGHDTLKTICTGGHTIGHTLSGHTCEIYRRNLEASGEFWRAQELYTRDLNLLQRVCDTYLLSKIWYCTQTLSIPSGQAQQITMSVLWLIWHGDIFRVATSTLHLSRADGGLGLIHVHATCLTLFITRLLLQCRKRETVTAVWIDTWRGHTAGKPPNRYSLVLALECLRTFF